MGRKTHKTAVVIVPPEEVWAPIQAIREQHDRQFRRWMPHITLIYPFRPRDEFEEIAARFEKACAQIRPFEVELATFSFFRQRHDRYTIWLAPEITEQLVQLQTILWGVVPDCNEVGQYEGGFTPHLSVGQARGREAMHKLIASFQTTWKPLTFVVSEVSMIWRRERPDDVFRVGKRIAIGRG